MSFSFQTLLDFEKHYSINDWIQKNIYIGDYVFMSREILEKTCLQIIKKPVLSKKLLPISKYDNNETYIFSPKCYSCNQ